jgi:hypothetical protein
MSVRALSLLPTTATSPQARVTLERWLRRAIRGATPPPAPVLLHGPGADDLGAGLLCALLRDGVDALPCPRSWIAPTGAGAPASLPPVVVLFTSPFDELDDVAVDALAARCGLIVVGEYAVPLVRNATAVALDLTDAQVAGLALSASTRWPAFATAAE